MSRAPCRDRRSLVFRLVTVAATGAGGPAGPWQGLFMVGIGERVAPYRRRMGLSQVTL